MAFIIGFLLGALATQGIWAGSHYVQEFIANKRHNPTVTSEQPEPTPFFHYSNDDLTEDKQKQCDANYTQTTCTCDSNDNKDNIEELTTCNNNIKQLETSNTHLKGKLYGFKQNFTTYINGLGDVIEEYSKGGKEWSQWCIQEWKEQGKKLIKLSILSEYNLSEFDIDEDWGDDEEEWDIQTTKTEPIPLESPLVYSRPATLIDINKLLKQFETINKELKESIGK
jgi:hypothetical protein